MDKTVEAEVVEPKTIGVISTVFTDDGKVEFEVATQDFRHVIIAMAGLKNHLLEYAELDNKDIIELLDLDDEKPNMKVRAKS